MASIMYKWMFLLLALPFHQNGFIQSANIHPLFISVTEIEHNAKEKTLEISCKLFTDDFEKTLRMTHKEKIDLLDPKQKTAMNPIVEAYIKQHLSIKADGKRVELQFLGFEQNEEGFMIYFQVNNISSVKKIEVIDNLLYEYKAEQMGIVHVIVKGNRKSTKLDNPAANASFEF